MLNLVARVVLEALIDSARGNDTASNTTKASSGCNTPSSTWQIGLLILGVVLSGVASTWHSVTVNDAITNLVILHCRLIVVFVDRVKARTTSGHWNQPH